MKKQILILGTSIFQDSIKSKNEINKIRNLFCLNTPKILF